MTRELSREALHTVQLVQITAFDGDGSVAQDTMRTLATRLFEAGIRVFIPCAGSSEFHTLSKAEIVAAVEMTRDVVGDQARVIVPLGLQLNYAIDLGRSALDAGAVA